MRLSLILFTISCFLFASFLPVQESKAQDMLEEFQWKNRLILIFSPSLENKLYQKQMSILRENENSLQDRDIILLSIFTDKIILSGKEVPSGNPAEIRKKYNINQGFTALLIGKDGFEKLRTPKPFSIKQLTETIDAMPMRKREMNDEDALDKNN